jgi:hypothetical protein
MPHYVYLYRDKQRRPRYVGYGKLVTRASTHLIRSHNPELADFVSKNYFTIEIAGPFETEVMGRAIETMFISALQPDFNHARGSREFRFRPLGVPLKFAERPTMPPLQRRDFFTAQPAHPTPILFVKVGGKDFGDGRAPYDPANPPPDDKILERVDRWWQIAGYLPAWAKMPGKSPGLLVGVTGSAGAQFVIASILIDRSSWNQAEEYEEGYGLVRVPIRKTPNLDAYGLRGRRIDVTANLLFEGIPAGFYLILHPNGRRIGGRRPR